MLKQSQDSTDLQRMVLKFVDYCLWSMVSKSLSPPDSDWYEDGETNSQAKVNQATAQPAWQTKSSVFEHQPWLIKSSSSARRKSRSRTHPYVELDSGPCDLLKMKAVSVTLKKY